MCAELAQRADHQIAHHRQDDCGDGEYVVRKTEKNMACADTIANAIARDFESVDATGAPRCSVWRAKDFLL
jgi:hypothetical protein